MMNIRRNLLKSKMKKVQVETTNQVVRRRIFVPCLCNRIYFALRNYLRDRPTRMFDPDLSDVTTAEKTP